MGDRYESGVCVVQSYENAVKYWTKAANQGHAASQMRLGWCYLCGHGVPADRRQAAKWLSKSADRGNSGAIQALRLYFPERSAPSVSIASQTDPAKLAKLKGERAANPCLQKCVYWLAYAEGQGEKPEAVLDESAKLNKTAATPYAGFLSWGLLENLKIAKELGLLTPKGWPC